MPPPRARLPLFKEYGKDFQATGNIESCFKLVIKTLLFYSSVECKLKSNATFLSEKQMIPGKVGKAGLAVRFTGSLGCILVYSFISPLIHPSFPPIYHASFTHLSICPPMHPSSTHPHLSIYLLSHPPTHRLSIIYPSCCLLTHFLNITSA